MIARLTYFFVSIFCFLLFNGIYGPTELCQAASDTETSPAPLAANESQSRSKPWYSGITTRWGGRIRTTGVASRVTNDIIYEPVGTGTYYDTATNFRLTNETFFSDTMIGEIHYQLIGAGGDTVRKQNELNEIFPGLPENLLYLNTSLNDDRRLMDLTDTIKDTDSWYLVQRIDRLFLSFLGTRASLRVGRQAITWGNGFVFNPMDLFNPFPPTTIDREYKTGDDMINAQVGLQEFGDLQLLYVARRNPENEDVEQDQASLAGKWHFALGNTEFDAMASKNYEDYVIGVGSRGYLGDAAWRLDATWTFLQGSDNYLSLAANMDYSWVWFKKNFYGFIEYYYNGLGRNDYAAALLDPAVYERLARGELFVLGKNYASSHIEVELHPLFKLTLTTINNVEDPSGIIQPYAVWDIMQDLQMTAGLGIYYSKKGSEFGGFKLPGTDLRNRPPDSAYLWFIYYF